MWNFKTLNKTAIAIYLKKTILHNSEHIFFNGLLLVILKC